MAVPGDDSDLASVNTDEHSVALGFHPMPQSPVGGLWSKVGTTNSGIRQFSPAVCVR